MKYSKDPIKAGVARDIKTLTSPQGYLWAGYPHYKTLFGRDALISAWQMLEINPRIAKDTLTILARFQGKLLNPRREEEPGKILHEYRTPGQVKKLAKRNPHFAHWGFPYYGSIDSTLLFIILAALYTNKTRDRAFLQTMWPHLKQALEWIGDFGDEDHDAFIEYRRKNPHGLYHQGWRDSIYNTLNITAPVALVEVQGYAYRAYQEGAALAKLVKEEGYARTLSTRAKTLKEKFAIAFWMKQQGFYAFALDKHKKKNRSVTSSQGHLLFTGIIDEKQKERKLVSRLFKPDLWTPYGIRTLSTGDRWFSWRSYHMGSIWPHDNWIIYIGLKMCGYEKEAEKIKRAIIRAHTELERIPEYYSVDLATQKLHYQKQSCYPQAWASGALLNMISK